MKGSDIGRPKKLNGLSPWEKSYVTGTGVKPNLKLLMMKMAIMLKYLLYAYFKHVLFKIRGLEL